MNMLVYDDPGNTLRHLAPDIFVAFGVEDRERDIYKLWEDECPAFVLEVTSKSTRRKDERKKTRYARWGVAEYYLYDPRGEYLKPALQGFELVGTRYRAVEAEVLPNGKRGFASGTLGLGLFDDPSGLRFYDPRTARILSTPREAEARAASEAALRLELEAKLADFERRWKALGRAEGSADESGPAGTET